MRRTAQQATSCPDVLLAIEDTTSVSYAHAVAADLGTTGSQREAKHRGYLVHSILLLEAAGERTIGLIEQRHWSRDAQTLCHDTVEVAQRVDRLSSFWMLAVRSRSKLPEATSSLYVPLPTLYRQTIARGRDLQQIRP